VSLLDGRLVSESQSMDNLDVSSHLWGGAKEKREKEGEGREGRTEKVSSDFSSR